ncbi:MAG: hypothetical protein ACR2OV_01850 [Hyphomicrobiaceae bacterium]
MHNARKVVHYPLPAAMVATMVVIGAVGVPLWVIPIGTFGFIVACMPAFRPTLVQARATHSVVITAVVWSGVIGVALILTAITYLLGFAIGDHLHNYPSPDT